MPTYQIEVKFERTVPLIGTTDSIESLIDTYAFFTRMDPDDYLESLTIKIDGEPVDLPWKEPGGFEFQFWDRRSRRNRPKRPY